MHGARARLIHHAFEWHVRRAPHAVAVACGREVVTYGGLNARANALAHELIARGIGPEQRVGVLLERSPDWIATVLGILKSGAAYVPFDLAWPAARIDGVARDCNLAMLVARRSRFVEQHIPWSARLTDEHVEWRGASGSVRGVARAAKDTLVLKLGRSRQGKHVFVGKFLSDDEWAAALERGGTKGDWLVQQYCPSDRLYAPSDTSEVVEHDAVWGVFAFGQEYGGAFGRVMESSLSQGVVNSARGAKQCVVLEV